MSEFSEEKGIEHSVSTEILIEESDKVKEDEHLDAKTLSKKARKRLDRKMKWEANKSLKRAKEREQRKLKRLEALKNNIKLGPSRKELKSSKMSNSNCKTSVIIDLSFDHLMIDKDIAKVVKQLLRAYTLNRRSENPMQLYFTNFNGKTKNEMTKHTGYQNWDVNFCENDYLDAFPKDKIVYLSSESDNVITELEQDKAYVIGGLVDHNAHKGLCLKIATEQNISHAQLPIKEFLKMKTRQVLTIDQVFEILLRISEGKSWEDAMIQVIPTRKGAVVINEEKNNENIINNKLENSS